MIIFLQKKPRKIKIRPLVPPTNMTPAHHPTDAESRLGIARGCDLRAAREFDALAS